MWRRLKKNGLPEKNNDHTFPSNAIQYCLREAGIDGTELDYVAFYDKPFLKFERILETYLAYAPFGIGSFLKAMPLWIKKKIWIKEIIKDELNYSGKIIFPEHHESHAASAFFPSPFQEAAFITMDGGWRMANIQFRLAKITRLSCWQTFNFLIHLDCFILRLLITLVLGLIPVNIK